MKRPVICRAFFLFQGFASRIPIMTLNHIDKAFGPQVLLDGVCLSVGRGVRIGLIRRNREGTSTLLKMMSGEVERDAGKGGGRKCAKQLE